MLSRARQISSDFVDGRHSIVINCAKYNFNGRIGFHSARDWFLPISKSFSTARGSVTIHSMINIICLVQRHVSVVDINPFSCSFFCSVPLFRSRQKYHKLQEAIISASSTIDHPSPPIDPTPSVCSV